MAKIEIDTSIDSPATIRTLAGAANVIADEIAQGKPAAAKPAKVEPTHTGEAALGPAGGDGDLSQHKSVFDANDAANGGEAGNDASTLTAEQGAGDATGAPLVAAGAETRVDHNGVLFNPAMCAAAAKPYYASGKRSGQWKKKGGAAGPDDATYDAWYASALAEVPAAETATTEPGKADTAAAFGAKAGATQETAAGVPTEVGPFFGLIADLQAAGTITQDQVGAAYEAAQVEVGDLFPPNDPAAVTIAIGKVYAALQAHL